MRSNIFSIFLSLSFLLNLASALPTEPPNPSDDDFYKMPDDLERYKEGQIMKWRNTLTHIRSVVYPINIKGSWQFMVRSTNTQGKPVGIVGSILEPFNADPTKVLGYSYFEDSVSKNCATSYTLLFGSGSQNLGNQLESIYMNAALTKGWYVLVTDYEGPNAAFTAGKLAGMATLDAMRATLASGEHTGIKEDAKIALWGFSGGTIPSAWAAVLQPTYAPELEKNLLAVAVGGWVTNITQVLEGLDGTLESGLVGAGILGLASEYPEINKTIIELVTPSAREKVEQLYGKCILGTIFSFIRTKWLKGTTPIFTDGLKLLEREDIKEMMNENILAINGSKAPIPKVPFFVYHGQLDSVVALEGNSQRVYDAWCAENMTSMEFAVSRTSGHFMEFAEGGAAGFEWLSNRFDGKPPVQGCEKKVRLNNMLYPGAGNGFLTIVRTTIRGILHEKLGPLANLGLPKIVEKVFTKILDEVLEKFENIHGPENQ